jgi:integrase
VTLCGRDLYLGKFGSRESLAEYDRIIAEWLANGRTLLRPVSGKPADVTNNELLGAFLDWAELYYVKNGRMTGEVAHVRYSIKPIRELYGEELARDFGPLQLKTVRQVIIDTGICRTEVNRRVRIIVRGYKWAVAEGMIPPSVHHGLQAVPGLRRGRCEVREAKPVRSVPDAFVDAIRPHLSRHVWAMVQLQRLSGMRPGEVCIMRTIDVDRTGRVWIYTPESHKTEHHGITRRIYLRPLAQELLRPWLRPELTAYLFQPREAEAERRAGQRRDRKSRVQPSQRDRRRRRPKKKPGEKYDANSYRQAIQYGVDKANAEAERRAQRAGGERGEPIPRWHPNQLRHNAATRLRREFGLDVARAVLGHSSPVVTEVYAELDAAKAAEAMERVG